MKCWRCGKEIDDHAGECVYCHAGQQRSVPVTKEGAALRELYDHYGAEMVFGNPVMLANGFGDVVSDTLRVDVKKVKNNLKAAMDAGIGQRYLEQLQTGISDPDFDARIKKVLTEDADMNEKAADRLIGWFDEMIGWKLPKAEPVQSVPKPVEIPSTPQVPPKPVEIPPTSPQPTKPPEPVRPKPNSGGGGKKSFSWIWIMVLLAAVILGYSLYQNRRQKTTNTTTGSAGVRVGDTITFGRYEQDQWSGADPIEWEVLAVENGRALLLSRYALETKPYHNNTFTAITWENSDLRTWLNGTFYNSAFTSSEKARIQEVRNSNPDNPDYGTNGGNDTKDKIFLLSIDEVRKYLPTNSDRQCQVTYIAKQNGAYVFENGNSFWWLRSPGSDSVSAAGVDYAGLVGTLGGFVDCGSDVVRPALWMNL